jgi:uncharacterized membrane protein YqjE
MHAARGTPEPTSRGLVDSAKRLLGTLVAIVHTRFELVATELQEEIARLARIVIWSVAALLLAAISCMFIAVTVLLATPPERRVLVAASIAAGSIIAALLSALVARRVHRSKPRPFDASLGELERDRERLGGKT